MDAVCIDQQNNEEKSTQIPLMGQIYRSASKVLAWLGEGGIEEGAIPLIQSISRRAIEYDGVLTDLPPVYYGYESVPGPLNSKSPQITDLEQPRALAVLKSFFDLPWFHRRWIIQEIVLNAESYLHYGNHQISWFRFMATIEKEFNKKSPPTNIHSAIRMFDLWRAWSLIPSRNNFSQTPHESDALLHYLTAFDEYRCQDPRDMIYALGALAGIRPLRSTNILGKTTFKPDYSQSTEQCYTNFATVAISRGYLIDILEQVNKRNYRPGGLDIPSWVPNWLVSPRRVESHGDFDYGLSVKEINDRTLKIEIDSIPSDPTAEEPNSSPPIVTVTHQASVPDVLDGSAVKDYLKAFIDASLGSAHRKIVGLEIFDYYQRGPAILKVVRLGDRPKLKKFELEGLDGHLSFETDSKMKELDLEGMDDKPNFETEVDKDFWTFTDRYGQSLILRCEEIGQLGTSTQRTVFLTGVFGNEISPAGHTEDEGAATVEFRYLGIGACRAELGDKIVVGADGSHSSVLVLRPVADPSSDCGQPLKYRFVGIAYIIAIAVSAESTSDQTIANRFKRWFRRGYVRRNSGYVRRNWGQWRTPGATLEIYLV